MRKILGILSVLAGLVVFPEGILAQQQSVAFARPLGIRPPAERSHADSAQEPAVHDEMRPGPTPYVVGGALVGGVLAGGWMGYEFYKGMKNGGESMINPFVPIAIVVGGGMVVGGIIGLCIYYGAHP